MSPYPQPIDPDTSTTATTDRLGRSKVSGSIVDDIPTCTHADGSSVRSGARPIAARKQSIISSKSSLDATQAGYDLARAIVRRAKAEPMVVLSLEQILERVYRSAIRNAEASQ